VLKNKTNKQKNRTEDKNTNVEKKEHRFKEILLCILCHFSPQIGFLNAFLETQRDIDFDSQSFQKI
jgi:hypothetical protein